jgi:IS1 family transposase
VYSKEKNTPEGETGKGSVWVWIAMDADTKLIISWLVGERNENFAHAFMKDLASRLKGETQITTDGYSHYTGAINAAFDTHVDFAQLVKQYSRAKTGEVHNNNETGNGGRYIGAKKVIMFGQPNPKFISTSYIERQNLTVRMCSRRFTRKTNAFSKKVENHGYALALNFVYYNFVRIHRSLRITPAMQAGLCKKPMTFADIATLA